MSSLDYVTHHTFEYLGGSTDLTILDSLTTGIKKKIDIPRPHYRPRGFLGNRSNLSKGFSNSRMLKIEKPTVVINFYLSFLYMKKRLGKGFLFFTD